MKRGLSTFGWFAIQIPIIGLWLYIAVLHTQKGGEPTNVGGFLLIGVLIAFSITYALSFLIDRYRLLRSRLRAWLRARRLSGQVNQSAGESRSLAAPHRSLGQLPKPPSRFRIGQQVR
jgi:hypothetical protein